MAVERGDIKYGIIPLENSSAGRVASVHDLLPQTKLFIVAEKNLSITHCLAGNEAIELKEIKFIHSHEQALNQCKLNLKQHCPNAQLIPELNTAIVA